MLKAVLGWLDSHLVACLTVKGTMTKNGVTMEANRQTCKRIYKRSVEQMERLLQVGRRGRLKMIC